MSLLSLCCTALPDERFHYNKDDGICSECGEHSEFSDEDIPEGYTDGTDDWIERVNNNTA